jgi:hypothetical protein
LKRKPLSRHIKALKIKNILFAAMGFETKMTLLEKTNKNLPDCQLFKI